MKDHALEMENYSQENHLMEITNALHMQKICLDKITRSERIARVEASSPTSNVSMID
jgi:hypothetical protein